MFSMQRCFKTNQGFVRETSNKLDFSNLKNYVYICGPVDDCNLT